MRRRRLLAGGGAALCGYALASGARAQQASPSSSPATKVSQQEAKYQGTPKGGLSCGLCTQFRAPRACQLVDGDISKSGWCALFDMVD